MGELVNFIATFSLLLAVGPRELAENLRESGQARGAGRKGFSFFGETSGFCSFFLVFWFSFP